MSTPARRPPVGALLLCSVLTLGLAGPAAAQSAEPELETETDPETETETETETEPALEPTSATVVLDDAREALKAGELDRAVAMLGELREGGGLAPDVLARAWLLEGMGRALLDDGGAERAFAIALRLAPDIDPGVKQADIRRPFDAARQALPPAANALAATATPRAATGGLKAGVRVELRADDLGLVAHVAIGDERRPLSADAPLAFVATDAPDEAPVILLDEHLNRLMRVALGDAPADAGQVAPATGDDSGFGAWFGLERFEGERWAFLKWPWVTLTGAGIGTLGLAFAIASGALVAIYDRGLLLPPAIDPLFKPAMFVGLGVGVVVILAGGATIAADQIVRHELWRSGDGEGDDGEGDDDEGDDASGSDEASEQQVLSWPFGARAALE